MVWIQTETDYSLVEQMISETETIYRTLIYNKEPLRSMIKGKVFTIKCLLIYLIIWRNKIGSLSAHKKKDDSKRIRYKMLKVTPKKFQQEMLESIFMIREDFLKFQKHKL